MISRAIEKIDYIGKNTNTADGLRKIRTQVLGKAGDRPDARNVVVVITDGKANREQENTLTEAKKIKALGTEVSH